MGRYKHPVEIDEFKEARRELIELGRERRRIANTDAAKKTKERLRKKGIDK